LHKGTSFVEIPNFNIDADMRFTDEVTQGAAESGFYLRQIQESVSFEKKKRVATLVSRSRKTNVFLGLPYKKNLKKTVEHTSPVATGGIWRACSPKQSSKSLQIPPPNLKYEAL